MADSESPWELAVIGAGAAGLIAAARAAGLGRRTLLLEKNSRAGVKILMSGGTRCNITQATDNQGIIEAFGPAGRFLHAALAAFGVQQTIELFEAEGVPTKTEETGKIFPVSNRAADVLAALLGRLHRSGAQLALGEALLEIQRDGDAFRLITTRRALRAANVLLTTGGQSYPGSGTTGDGYVWARQFGHTIVTPHPALTPLTVQTDWVRGLRGITIPDVALRIVEPASTSSAPPSPVTTGRRKSRTLAERRGSLLFTHFGLSGPVALDVSRCVSGHAQPRSLVLQCDFLPNTSNAQLEELLRQETRVAGKKQLSSILPAHLPRRLVESLLHVAGVSPESKAAEASKRELALVVDVLKRCQLPIAGTLGFGKAEVTAGGVALDEVDPRTMQSKLAPGLYFAGEILDLDGPIGGYNFQAAWSTGWLAGQRGPRD